MKRILSTWVMAALAVSALAQPAGDDAAKRKPRVEQNDEGYFVLSPRPKLGTGVILDPAGRRREVTYEIVNGRARFEGDIDLGPVDAAGNLVWTAPPEGPTATGVNSADRAWPDCVVPWRFDAGVNATIRALITQAIEEWRTTTACRFPLKSSAHRDFVTFEMNTDPRPVSSSPVGKVGGEQTISINDKTRNPFTVVHEIGHSLGLFHEQGRSDRNSFVTVNLANVHPDARHNFLIYPNAVDIGPYNFNSIMHYPATAFGEPPGSVTITARVPGVTFGQRSVIDAADAAGVMEIQGLWRKWSYFQPSPPAGSAAPGPASLGPLTEKIYYDFLRTGVRMCRTHFPWTSAPDCSTTVIAENLAGLPAATPSPNAKGEVAIFARGDTTGAYYDYRRDYITNGAGGDARLQTDRAGTGWLSDPAAITLDKRILVFGLRGRVDKTDETVVALVFKDQGDPPWSPIIELPALAKGHAFSPTVVSTRAGIWTLFILDGAGRLWATEGDRDGKIVTAWKMVSDLTTSTGGTASSGPSATVTTVPNNEILVVVSGLRDHLHYAGFDAKLNQTDPWHNIGGLLTSRPSVLAVGSGAYVMANVQAQPHWSRVWRP